MEGRDKSEGIALLCGHHKTLAPVDSAKELLNANCVANLN